MDLYPSDLVFPIALFVSLLVLLPVELSFMLTSHVFGCWTCKSEENIVHWLWPYMLVTCNPYTPAPWGCLYSWDWRCLQLLVCSEVLIAVALASRNANVTKVVSGTVIALCFALIPLPVEVFFFDRGEFTMRVASMLSDYNLGWFSNADFLYVLSALLAASLFVFKHAEKFRIFL